MSGLEHTQRLEEAMVVKTRLEAQGLKVISMTFGGIHEGHKTVSPAEAGKQGLVEHGVPEEDIATRPVAFSGNDEDRMAAEFFVRDMEFSQLHIVLST